MIEVNCPCCGKKREITEEQYYYDEDKYPCLDCYYEGSGEI